MSILLQKTQERVNELKQQEEAKIAENKRQNEVARQQRLEREQKAKDTKTSEREAERSKAEDKLKADLRRYFMSANSSASDEDFERLYPSLRDEHLKNQMQSDYERQLASARQHYNIL